MKRALFLISIVLPIVVHAGFEDLFHPRTLRIDYYHSGDHASEFYTFDQARIEPYWGGSLVNLIDTFQYGNHYFKVFLASNDSLIYSRGYSSLFREWQTTSEALATSRSFTETVVCPLPREACRIVFYSRDGNGKFQEKFTYAYDPSNYFISPERTREYPVFDALVTGPPSSSVDIVVLPEGYTEAEMGQFISDVMEFSEILFQFAPYDRYADKFNIRGVLASSDGSGSDIPADTVWARTLMNTSFYTFDSERYCMTYDNKSVRDLASNAPYDQIYILVNSEKYGGGAIYNYYNVSVNSNRAAAKIFIHEFGHGFAGLGDEYYNSEVAYSAFYPQNIEPWEPNLTTLVSFDSKWKHMLNDSIPVPTPMTEEYRNTLGVFEGGGYVSKGVYRPGYDCLMNTFKGDQFCGACKEAIEKMIRFYTEDQ
jgi:hypothetical protein